MKNKEALAIVVEQLLECLQDENNNVNDGFGDYTGRYNRMTAHHMTPRRSGGRTTPDNIYPLSEESHKIFNFIENKNQHYADNLTEGMEELKAQKKRIIIEQLKCLSAYYASNYDYDREKRLYLRRS